MVGCLICGDIWDIWDIRSNMEIKKIQYGAREWIVDQAVFPGVFGKGLDKLFSTGNHTTAEIERALEFIIALHYDNVKYIRTSVHYNPYFLEVVRHVASVLGLCC
jgi:hypothetical protein